jgi:hypothetical protein
MFNKMFNKKVLINRRFQAMKQINPLAIHSESLYRMSELNSQASRDKLALETKRNRPGTSRQVQGQRVWLRQKLAGLGKLAHHVQRFREKQKAFLVTIVATKSDR